MKKLSPLTTLQEKTLIALYCDETPKSPHAVRALIKKGYLSSEGELTPDGEDLAESLMEDGDASPVPYRDDSLGDWLEAAVNITSGFAQIAIGANQIYKTSKRRKS